MSRYMASNLQKDLDGINQKLDQLEAPYRLVMELSCGTTKIARATPEQIAEAGYSTIIETGTPAECLTAATRWFANEVLNIVAERGLGPKGK